MLQNLLVQISLIGKSKPKFKYFSFSLRSLIDNWCVSIFLHFFITLAAEQLLFDPNYSTQLSKTWNTQKSLDFWFWFSDLNLFGPNTKSFCNQPTRQNHDLSVILKHFFYIGVIVYWLSTKTPGRNDCLTTIHQYWVRSESH